MEQNQLGQWLEAELRTRGWSQSFLARKMGVGRSVVNEIVMGKRTPHYELSRKLAVALALPVEEVFRITGMLPPDVTKNNHLRLNYLYDLLPEEDKARVVVILEALTRKQENQINVPT